MKQDFAFQRQQLIAILQKDGIRDGAVLNALVTVPRELFVETSFQDLSYSNQALPLDCGQTISQPLMVAIMTQALQLSGQERVLEIGTGSGYQAAVLSHLARHVYSIERYPQLSEQAATRLAQLQRQNVSLLVGDGSIGCPEYAPYDRILVTAAAPYVPQQLVSQLTIGGMLVLPVGDHAQQELRMIRRQPTGVTVQLLGRCVFVPLIGEDAWKL